MLSSSFNENKDSFALNGGELAAAII